MNKKDHLKEKMRFDEEAKNLSRLNKSNLIGINSIEPIYRDCYEYYHKTLTKFINTNDNVLEIACGYGRHSLIPISTCKSYTGLDISAESILLAKKTFNFYKNAKFINSDFLNYNFTEKFDVIVCAGSLSYFKLDDFLNKIKMISNNKTRLIFVDSLNNNLFYKAKRYFDYLLGRRTYSTIVNMPTYSIINKLKKNYNSVDYKCFGILIFLNFLTTLVGEKCFIKFSKSFDSKFNFFEKYSFKIVINVK